MSMEVPEYLRSGPGADAAKKALADAASMAASSNSVPRISLRGREFRVIENGEEIKKYRDEMQFVIVGVEPDAGFMIKTFYSKGYQSGAKEPPSCSSEDGIAPAPWVQEKQAPTCRQCPKNVFGSAISPSGKQTKACRDSKRAWIVLADDPRPVHERTLYGLNVTVASLKAFSDHGRKLHAAGVAPFMAITRAKMMDAEFPQLDFELAGWVSQSDLPQVTKLNMDKPWKIQFAGAGLALAMSGGADASTARATLPTSLPGQTERAAQAPVMQAPASQPVQDAVVRSPIPDVGNTDVDSW
jgi:hypothetical protein